MSALDPLLPGADHHVQFHQAVHLIEHCPQHRLAVLLDNQRVAFGFADQTVILQVASQCKFVVANLDAGDGLREERWQFAARAAQCSSGSYIPRDGQASAHRRRRDNGEGVGLANATGNHRQEVAVDTVEREHRRGELVNKPLFAQFFHQRVAHRKRAGGMIAALVGPGPEPGLGFFGLGAEQLGVPDGALPKESKPVARSKCQSSPPTNSPRWSCLSKEEAA